MFLYFEEAYSAWEPHRHDVLKLINQSKLARTMEGDFCIYALLVWL